ncbi:interleukin-1 receptor type 2-like [Dendrobates tinctorius]|uniref:interleukin-1 receptor type 2-like n=1 Tax=Dendrobates tinctorius TaxID=92724 RepID=UPI003CC9B75E
MMKMCALCVLYTWISLDIRDAAKRNMAPRIIEPLKNMNLYVEAGSKIDLRCCTWLGSNSPIELINIYWLINGTFIQNDSCVQESLYRVYIKEDQTYVNITLHINDVIPEIYNIPITCIVDSPWGTDNSTLYLRALNTGSSKWAIIFPLCLVIFGLLLALAYKHLIDRKAFTFID